LLNTLKLKKTKLLGPFEEEEEGMNITSDVVKVKGEDRKL